MIIHNAEEIGPFMYVLSCMWPSWKYWPWEKVCYRSYL